MSAEVIPVDRPSRQAEPQRKPSQSDSVGWRMGLIGDKRPRAIIANAITALRCAPEWEGVLGFNEFSLGATALKRAPWGGPEPGTEWSDHEDRLAADWLQHEDIYVSPDIAGQAVQTVAREIPFHPVRNYLNSLRWDGEPRLESWPIIYLGVQPQMGHEDSESLRRYVRAVGSRFLVQAVARIYRPGVKADCCLILEGAQGLKKSTALKTISQPWFTDEIADLGTKDAAMQTRGVWLIEIAELDSISRSEVGAIKAFMSRATDRFRPPYGKRLVESPRQCVFAGSVNNSTYLRDETGGRRFWPLACTDIDIDRLAQDRDQLWAEAKVRYEEGGVWWLDSAELNEIAREEQAGRYEGDPWDELIARWVESPARNSILPNYLNLPFTSDFESVTTADVLTHCIGKRQDQWSQPDKNRVARALRAFGWERYKARNGRDREWRYRRVSQ